MTVLLFRRVAGPGRPSKQAQFPQIVPTLLEFAKVHAWEAAPRRRVSTARSEGFRLRDALRHLHEAVPGLYAAGCSRDTAARVFKAPRRGTIAGRRYTGNVDARVQPKRNSARKLSHNTHVARAQQKLLEEWHAFHEQINVSGDDMNTIQVGRPAVSRYHTTRRLYMTGEGVNYDVHDFPSAELGLKLGGFIVLTSATMVEDDASGSDEGEDYGEDCGEEADVDEEQGDIDVNMTAAKTQA